MFLLKNIWLFTLYVCDVSHFSHIRLFTALWTIASQDPQSMRFSRQEYWSGLPCTSPGDILDPGIKPAILNLPTNCKFLYQLYPTVRGILQARVMGWVTISFSRVSYWPKDWTLVSCTAGRFFTVWATIKWLQLRPHPMIRQILPSK